MEEKILFEFFGEVTKDSYDNDAYASYHSNPFIINVQRENGKILFSIDLIKSYNKTSQCPIHFVISNEKRLSRRKKNRIFEALHFLQRNEKDAGGFFGSMPGFDDLSEVSRANFWY